MNTIKLAKECGVQDNMETVGFMSCTHDQLEAFAQAVIEEYKASLVPVAWMQRQGDYFENEQDEYHSIPLYDLGETK